MKRNTDYKNAALAALKGNWGKAVLATVIFMAVIYFSIGPYMYQTFKLQAFIQENMPQVSSSVSIGTAIRQSMEASLSMAQDPEYMAMQSKMSGSMGLYYLLLFFVVMPLFVGFCNALHKLLVQGDNAISGNMIKMATTGYWHKVWGMFLMNLFIFLWSLLFIIPGIVKTFSYAMTPFILEERPDLGASEAIDHSRAMMKGHKFDLFWLLLSFIGWGFLCLFTFGIGYLWLIPYMQTSVADFYEDVKADYEANGGLI
ncbi:MAG: DUF975 family protein [Bacteroidales bacterium]|nr:DUF975 family protein [Bacteroidales bacterium]